MYLFFSFFSYGERIFFKKIMFLVSDLLPDKPVYIPDKATHRYFSFSFYHRWTNIFHSHVLISQVYEPECVKIMLL